MSELQKWLSAVGGAVALYIGQAATPKSVLPYDNPLRLIAVVIAVTIVVVSVVIAVGKAPHPRLTLHRRIGKPVLRVKKTGDYMRSANASRLASDGSSLQDLQVIYARVTNEGRAPAKHAEIWMEAFAKTDHQTSVSGNKGNWLDLSEGRPQILSTKTRTLSPNREEHGIEVAGKFLWGQDAWIAGETDPSLKAGMTYVIRASVTPAGATHAVVLEWEVENRGADSPLIYKEIKR